MQNVQLGVLGCTVWIPVAIWVYAMVSWMITDDVDVLTGLVGLVAAFGAGAFVMTRYSDPLAPYINGAVWTVVFIYPTAKHLIDKRALITSDIEAMARAYETLSLRPGNLGSIMKICGFAVRYGAPEHGIAAAEQAIKPFPAAMVAEDQRQIRTWKATYSSSNQNAITCAVCGTSNSPGDVLCLRCGGPYLLYQARGTWIAGPAMKKLVTVWVAMLVASIGIGIAGTSLPRDRAMMVSVGILGLCGIGVWLAFSSIRPKK